MKQGRSGDRFETLKVWAGIALAVLGFGMATWAMAASFASFAGVSFDGAAP